MITSWSQMGHASTLIKNRTFLSSVVAKKISRGNSWSIIVAIAPLRTHPILGDADEIGAIRAEVVRAFRLSAVSSNVTRVEYCTQLDAKGAVPQWLIDVFVVPRLVSWASEIRQYFQQMRPMKDCVLEDGRYVGMMLTRVVNQNRRSVESFLGRLRLRSLILEFFSKTAMLRDAKVAHLDAFLLAVLTGSNMELELGTADSETAPMVAIGLGLDMFLTLHYHGTHVVVASFVGKHNELRDIDERHVWFRPLLAEIVAWRIQTGTFGKKLWFASARFGRKVTHRLRSLSSIYTPSSVAPEADLARMTPAPQVLQRATSSKPELDFVAVTVSHPGLVLGGVAAVAGLPA